MAFAYCPDCGRRIYLGAKAWKGQPVSCDSCEASLEVVALNPPRLEWVDDEAPWDWTEEDQEPARRAAGRSRSAY